MHNSIFFSNLNKLNSFFFWSNLSETPCECDLINENVRMFSQLKTSFVVNILEEVTVHVIKTNTKKYLYVLQDFILRMQIFFNRKI